MVDDDPRAIFQHIYDTEHWEGGSGQGSRVDVTETYRRIVQEIVRARDVRTVVDVGCGDWEFANLIDWSGVSYLGVDVLPTLIETNRAEFGKDGIAFECMNLHESPPPPADALLCKDVLQHWPVEWIADFLTRVSERYRYMLITNDIDSVHCPPDRTNSQIPLGQWRTIDLESDMFGLVADWRLDYDIRGEWTKRTLLVVSTQHRRLAKWIPGSALRRLKSLTLN
jgi:SAM-dependent methyltransferase